MKIKYLFALLVGSILVSMSGCSRQAFIHDVPPQPIATNKAQTTTEEIEKAIITAGAGLGWIMHIDNPQHITGTLHLRAHMAKVGIHFDSNTYSIKYLDSQNLKYAPVGTELTDVNGDSSTSKKATIHKNYNSWVTNLDRAIKAQLSAIY